MKCAPALLEILDPPQFYINNCHMSAISYSQKEI